MDQDIISISGGHEINPPRRSTAAGAAIICADVALLCALMLLPGDTRQWTAAALALLAVCAVVLRSVRAVHLSLFCLLWAALPLVFPASRPWPFSLIIPVAVYGVTAAALPPLRRSFGWLRRGRPGYDILVPMTATVVLSGIALVIWYVAAKPDHDQFLRYMPRMPVWMFPLAGLGFAMGNAALEEAIFRGIVMDALDSALGPGPASILLQSVPFAILHLSGFPGGGWGMAMVLVYGLALGSIRRRSRGMLAPWLTHVAADGVIFAILVRVVLHG
ncbi:MAG TPA: CPBP family intramembrane glutamic endopeptidase [Geobacteraceae bacterium]|nr:CPBP family intramembrane glutamic endopeptidase [Geobacteraceae bacterium]